MLASQRRTARSSSPVIDDAGDRTVGVKGSAATASWYQKGTSACVAAGEKATSSGVAVGELDQPAEASKGFLLAVSANSATRPALFSLIVVSQRATACSPVTLMVPGADSESVTPAATVSLQIAAAVISLPKNDLRDWPQQTHQKAPNPPDFPLTHSLAVAPLGGFGG
jgi:hypothetical protein